MGKTYLYHTLIALLRRQNERVLSYATIGIAVDLLIDGKTVPNGLKLPFPLYVSSASHMQIPSESSENSK